MARPTSPKERERQQQQARSQSKQAAADKANRRRRVLGIVGAVLVLAIVLGTVGAVIAGSSSKSDSGAATTGSTASTTTTAVPKGASQIPAVEPGATLAGATPCPAEDGSSPRTTQFAGPPPTCIEAGRDYQAVIHTNVGDITVLLSTAQAPGAVNNFVVLSRYHFYDGQSFAPIIKKTLAAVAPKFTGSDASPGYTLPSEVPPEGQMRGPFTMSALPVDASGAFDAAFFITTYSNAPDTDAQPTTFGLVLDGNDAINAIDQAGSEEGSPSSAVIITGIEISPSIPVD